MKIRRGLAYNVKVSQNALFNKEGLEGTRLFDCFSYKVNGLGVSGLFGFVVNNEFQFAIFLFCLRKHIIPTSLFHIPSSILLCTRNLLSVCDKNSSYLANHGYFQGNLCRIHSVSHYGEQYLIT